MREGVPPTGFEPATCPLGEGRSIRLSYEGALSTIVGSMRPDAQLAAS